jgi:hypothetical protein
VQIVIRLNIHRVGSKNCFIGLDNIDLNECDWRVVVNIFETYSEIRYFESEHFIPQIRSSFVV